MTDRKAYRVGDDVRAVICRSGSVIIEQRDGEDAMGCERWSIAPPERERAAFVALALRYAFPPGVPGTEGAEADPPGAPDDPSQFTLQTTVLACVTTTTQHYTAIAASARLRADITTEQVLQALSRLARAGRAVRVRRGYYRLSDDQTQRPVNGVLRQRVFAGVGQDEEHYTTIAARVGVTPDQASHALVDLARGGRVQRPRRGYYMLPTPGARR